MKQVAILILTVISVFISEKCLAQALVGEISKNDFKKETPQIIDKDTKNPISGAIITVPAENIYTKSDTNGYFNLSTHSNSPLILSIQKEGYRPFSMTLQNGKLEGGVTYEMSKTSPFEIIVTDNMIHLGDNSYSENSAGACQINSPCVGPSFTKDFYIKDILPKTKYYVSIGSVIGIDTIQAMKLGQNKLKNAFSTPLEIFVNKRKIGELKINGDNQKIQIPQKFLKQLANNTLTVTTGENTSATDYTDYDDVELMNLIIDIKN